MLFAAVCAVVALGVVVSATGGGQVPSSEVNLVNAILPTADDLPIATGTGGSATVGSDAFGQSAETLAPAGSGTFANAAPPSVADQPPLRSHEVFGFAPYWTLPDSTEFDLSGLTTVDYFSIGLNPDGSASESGAGWQGYQSQNFIDLIDRAHAAGDRVVLTVNDFSQSSLDRLTSSVTAPAELAETLLFLVKSKNLDGINLDLEGAGSSDQSGLTNLVKFVSTTLHQANPNYQVTMDTYASSAGDGAGFYNIHALNQFVDGFFVMAYQLNLKAGPSAHSPMTSSMFSNQTTAQQYAAAVPAAKVLLGLPFFGYDWPTTNGTLDAQPDGAPSVITYGQEASSGHRIYWDAVTDTAWTSYQVGQQWHEAFFEDPTSLYLAAQLAQANGLGGVGIWALGMDGNSFQSMVSALDGSAPAQKDTLAGPTSTSSSPAGPSAPVMAALKATTTTRAPRPASTKTTRTTRAPVVRTTTTRAAVPTTTPVIATYAGTWLDQQLSVIPTKVAAGKRTYLGPMTSFVTNNPAFSCLENEKTLEIYTLSSDPTHDYVIARTATGDCVNGAFVFAVPDNQPPTGDTTTTTSTSTTTTTIVTPNDSQTVVFPPTP